MKRKDWLVGIVILGMALVLSIQAQAGGFEGKLIFRDGRINLRQVEVPGLGAVQATPAFAKKAVAVSFDTYRQVMKEVGESAPGVRVNTATIWVKGNLLRTDMNESEGKTAVIYDSKAQKLTTISWKEKKAIVIDVGKMMKAMNSVAEQMGKAFGLDASAMKQMMQGNQPEKENDLFSLKPTGKKKKINGFKCELYEGTDKDGNPLQVWLATPTQTLRQLYQSMEEMTKALEKSKKMEDNESKFFEKTDKFPVLKKWVENNSEFHFEEFVSMKKQSVSADMFKVPAGFQVISMENMMQNGLKQLQQFQQQK
ncbi:MAG: DUF4412 domain-containing protein [Calditrichaeota bacterium]|nr:DUF4412 domain-containing protein [Calditrichota bacterium]